MQGVKECDPSCYEVLGIDMDATLEDIQQAYRQLALKHHPDKQKQEDKDNNKDNSKFLEIQQSYEILKDHTKRKEYDAKLKQKQYRTSNIPISFRVKLSECTALEQKTEETNDDKIENYEYPCRCGDFFDFEMQSSNSTDSSLFPIIVSCPTCFEIFTFKLKRSKKFLLSNSHPYFSIQKQKTYLKDFKQS
ncbi:hypothetical protein RFI_27192 [Reticulomyxa filosa]|uniref:J domain-containing protein n=1 Tax=Reticulomyxa filosa TaxID=46433 RepID=X6M8D6_RETFI|nr:hypothetical protein RFI_27192 [Reticulomyxa filosa]|eukprot:ETO10184.1 hypothetical protein RFI_27192 [Reticulomyxa filosa]